MKTTGLRNCFISSLILISGLVVAAENPPASVSGKWQLSWEARLGTEHGTLQLDQDGAKLTGNYHGHLASQQISGTVKDKTITLDLAFPGPHPFTLIFRGTIDGEKMAGKFEIQGVPSGYDAHGENASPSNYSWTAARQPDQTRRESTPAPQSDSDPAS
jgi:hypothetical protein